VIERLAKKIDELDKKVNELEKRENAKPSSEDLKPNLPSVNSFSQSSQISPVSQPSNMNPSSQPSQINPVSQSSNINPASQSSGSKLGAFGSSFLGSVAGAMAGMGLYNLFFNDDVSAKEVEKNLETDEKETETNETVNNDLSEIGSKLEEIDAKLAELDSKLDENVAEDDIAEDFGNYEDELEESAVKLAKSEREEAWREIAKQVAHEINNPLTPMRLTVQSFQRRFDPNDEDIKEKIFDTYFLMIDKQFEEEAKKIKVERLELRREGKGRVC